MRSRVTARILGVLLVLLAQQGCDAPTGPDLDYSVPPRTGDGWQTASLGSVGLDESRLEELLRSVADTPDHLLHGLLVVRGQKLVFEAYWAGREIDPATLEMRDVSFDRERLHFVASVSKSVTSALAGIAWDRGWIADLDAAVFEFFPEHSDLRTDEKAGVTLWHLLSFTSGYDWNEFEYGFDDPRDSHYRMFRSEDPVRHLLGRPMITEPGSTFHYNSGDTNLVGEVVRRQSPHASLATFAEASLFGPLGITTAEWRSIGQDPHVTFASGGVSMRPRDMAKLGLLYLQRGIWNGTRVLSAEWVDASTQMAVRLEGEHRSLYGYGYNWWLGRSRYGDSTVEYFRALGWGGQNVFVYPELDMVVVFTAGAYYDASPLSVNDLLEDYILEAALGDPPS